jgi:DNA polymerase elongation subunit (family B)
MNKYNFTLVNCDTDSIMFCKQDQTIFTEEEQRNLIDEINRIMPESINYENDGFFSRVIIVKAKNYVMYNGEKLSYKGSAFKSATKEKALSDLLKEVIEALIFETDTPVNIYHKYIKEALNITDIKRWAVKKSITKKLLEGTRKNETKVLDALDIDSLREGDKVYLYNDIDGQIQDTKKGEPVFLKNGTPKMIDNHILREIGEFSGKYDELHYVERVYKTMNILKTVIDMETIPRYHLSKNQHLLEQLRD